MSANPGFQVSLDVKGRPCVVVGGDDEAAEKVRRLLEAGAKVTVVSPSLNDALRRLTASAKVIHRGRLFRATDADGVVLVINTVGGDDAYARSLFDLAVKERFLLCTTDRPEYSTVMMPALVSRGHLRIAISTSGVAPALASRLRQDFEEMFDRDFPAFLEWLAQLREDIQKAEPDAEQRRIRLREAVEGFKVTGAIRYPKTWFEKHTKKESR